MNREYFDTHAHYDEPVYDGDRETFLKSLSDLGVREVIDPSYDTASLERVQRIAAEYPIIKPAYGFHPQYVYELTEKDWESLSELLKSEQAVALGECGLDYRGLKPAAENTEKINAQKQAFKRQLDIAAEMKSFERASRLYEGRGIPVIVHSVAAAEDTIEILSQYPQLGGVIHGFSYSAEMALRFVRLGWRIGVGTSVLKADARKIKEVIEKVPAEMLVTETDAPFLTPPGRDEKDPYLIADIAATAGL